MKETVLNNFVKPTSYHIVETKEKFKKILRAIPLFPQIRCQECWILLANAFVRGVAERIVCTKFNDNRSKTATCEAKIHKITFFKNFQSRVFQNTLIGIRIGDNSIDPGLDLTTVVHLKAQFSYNYSLIRLLGYLKD